MKPRPKLTQAQKLDDALVDAEMFISSTMGELTDAVAHLRIAKQAIRMRRLTLARILKRLS